MTLGPLQFVVIGFPGNRFTGEILPEIRKLRDQGTIRLIDALFIAKDARGTIEGMETSDLSDEEAEQFGAIVGGLIGLGAGGQQGAKMGAQAGALGVAEHDYGLSQQDIQNIARDIPKNSSAAIILFEHHWAVPLKETIQRAGGVLFAQGLVQPAALVEFGAELAAADAAGAS